MSKISPTVGAWVKSVQLLTSIIARLLPVEGRRPTVHGVEQCDKEIHRECALEDTQPSKEGRALLVPTSPAGMTKLA